VVANDTDVDGVVDPMTVNLDVPTAATAIIYDVEAEDVIGFTIVGQGVWAYNEVTGEVTFTPEPNYTGTPDAITYTVRDNDGNESDSDGNVLVDTETPADIVVTYEAVAPTLVADFTDGHDTNNPVSVSILANDTLADGNTPFTTDIIATLVAPASATSVVTGASNNTIGFTIVGEGSWIYDETSGLVTFTPEAGFTDDPTPIEYTLEDVDNGAVSTSSSITIDYEIEYPIADSDEGIVIYPEVPGFINILDGDYDTDGVIIPTTVNFEVPAGATSTVLDGEGDDIIGFTVPTEGTWLYTYDATTGEGEVAFTPFVGFLLDPTPVSYTIRDNDDNVSNVATVGFDYTNVVNLGLTKEVIDETDFVLNAATNQLEPVVGSEITFEVIITNSGPHTAPTVVVEDIITAGYDYLSSYPSAGTYDDTTGRWEIGDIPTMESESLQITVRVNDRDASDVAYTDYTNTAQIIEWGIFTIDENLVVTPSSSAGWSAFDDDFYGHDTSGLDLVGAGPFMAPSDYMVDIFTTPARDLDLSISKVVVFDDVAQQTFNKGDMVTFEVAVTNASTSNLSATGVVIEDDMATAGEGFDLKEFDPSAGAFDEVTGQWSLTNELLPGETETLTLVVEVLDPDVFTTTLKLDGVTRPQADIYTNNVSIIAIDQAEYNSADLTLDLKANNVASAEPYVPFVELGITKELAQGGDQALPEENVTFVLTVEFNEDTTYDQDTATGVVATDLLPLGYEYVSHEADQGSYDATTGEWTIGELEVSDVVKLSIEATLKGGSFADPSLSEASLYDNFATVTSDQHDTYSTNNSSSVEGEVAPVCGEIYNKFSPNGDGINDVFYIDCIERYPNNSLVIYNRWGNVVYEKSGYDNTFNGYSTGRATVYDNEQLPVGTYFYSFDRDVNDGAAPESGWIYLSR